MLSGLAFPPSEGPRISLSLPADVLGNAEAGLWPGNGSPEVVISVSRSLLARQIRQALDDETLLELVRWLEYLTSAVSTVGTPASPPGRDNREKLEKVIVLSLGNGNPTVTFTITADELSSLLAAAFERESPDGWQDPDVKFSLREFAARLRAELPATAGPSAGPGGGSG